MRALLPLFLFIFICSLAACSGASTPESGKARPFVEQPFDQAVARATAEGRLLLVDFMADWCPPCRKMDEQTWPDAALAAWIGEHALALQVDADEEPALAARFGVRSLPTVLVLRDGVEVARRIGFQSAADLVAFCDSLRAGS